ncbi:biotin transporter BioY [Ovoidimarina sediminis]|uniref:biotin transporter BioY n=1 Tax=Ovoidimarina sediminis TaxID=3079856 RepID=UPI002912FBC2|nr:biotin transporter BioY [Rhodophyticola sp. MJ-SS7]MDU8945283.1 biotin transporter BioY [Rhodophyticola sp. MJ-SS7]
MSDTIQQPTLRTAFGPRGLTMSILMVVAGSALMTLAAKVQVPFFPVPMTMQVLVALLIGAAYGPRLAAVTIGAYLAQGAAGLPVFAGTPEKGIGLAYMAGPTGGYLLGFLLAAITTGWLAERGGDRGPFRLALTGLSGIAAIYVPGLLWLGTLIGWDQPVLVYGLWPFVPAEILKLALFVVIVHLGTGALRRR